MRLSNFLKPLAGIGFLGLASSAFAEVPQEVKTSITSVTSDVTSLGWVIVGVLAVVVGFAMIRKIMH